MESNSNINWILLVAGLLLATGAICTEGASGPNTPEFKNFLELDLVGASCPGNLRVQLTRIGYSSNVNKECRKKCSNRSEEYADGDYLHDECCCRGKAEYEEAKLRARETLSGSMSI